MLRSSRRVWLLAGVAFLTLAVSASFAEDPIRIACKLGVVACRVELTTVELTTVELTTLEPRHEAAAAIPSATELLISCGPHSYRTYESRSGELRAKLLQDGGNAASEAAVAGGLEWLVTHQSPDGGWTFDLKKTIRDCKCSHAGTLPSPGLATALAVLSILGDGQTHKQGQHKKSVGAGLFFLTKSIRLGPSGASLRDEAAGGYADALGTLALCEGYALTWDKGLIAPAQSCLRHLVHQQDPVHGGWRTKPTSRWQTPLTVWHLSALHAGREGYLLRPSPELQRASAYLDSVMSDEGAAYGFSSEGKNRLATAAALWGRMQSGWKQNDPRLAQGVALLDEWGPSEHHMLYNLFAHQVQRHFQGPGWPDWNTKLRDHLIATQDRSEGCERGSWHFVDGDDPGNQWGGRLYHTALATLILETYYFRTPIYARVDHDDSEFDQ